MFSIRHFRTLDFAWLCYIFDHVLSQASATSLARCGWWVWHSFKARDLSSTMQQEL